MKSLFSKISVPKVYETKPFNNINGNDAETLAASKMVLACSGEISWGSRNEDSSKIDLICSYNHPWRPGERILILTQVKSGNSYGETLADGFILKTTAKQLAQRTSHSICVIWIDRKVANIYWAYIHPNSTGISQEYGRNHIVTPALRYDLARCISKDFPAKTGGIGVILSKNRSILKVRRQVSLDKYRLLGASGIMNPHLGKIEVTRIGWRHMFRKSRSQRNKDASLVTILNLDSILIDKASEEYISRCEFITNLDYTYRQSEYVLIYDKVKLFNPNTRLTENVKVIVRVLEEIHWPNDWLNKSTLGQMVKRRVVLLSCYYKY